MTTFQRVNLGIGVALLALVAGLASARSQTIEEAARANVLLGVNLCLTSGQNLHANLSAAGFAHSIDSQSAVETDHRYSAPAGTAAVLVNEGEAAGSCTVVTQHLGIEDAVQLVGAYLNQAQPGRFNPVQRSAPPCLSYEDNAPIPLAVAVWTGDDSGACQQTGQVRISIFSAV